MPKIREIVFTGDFFRSSDGEVDQMSNVLWLHSLLSSRLGALADLPSRVCMPNPSECYAKLDLLPSLDAWANLFWNDADARLLDLLWNNFAHSLIIGIEIPPLLENCLDALGIHWIEVNVSPLRFLPDFALVFRFSDRLSKPSSHFPLLNEEIQRSVERCKWHYGSTDVKGTVFFAQTVNDRTLIGRDGFVTVRDVLDNISPDFVKLHPLCPENPLAEALVARGAAFVHENTYALLNSDIEVITVSSSVSSEAECFNRPVKVLNPEVLERNKQGMVTLKGHLNHGFWRSILKDAISLTDIEFDTPFAPNVLRNQLNSYSLNPSIYSAADFS